MQLQEAVDRIIAKGAKKVIVSTDERTVPAQRNYESVGFVRLGTREYELIP